ncbi:MAG: nicotinamide riboside transporter PnuC [Paludibacter sp.]|nr:nicotinamide riboside transporter PnuC [Paludibacter sp.]MDD4199481.1 nicotinamide riboside transporter PnuC [Paludibacter sp.]MDD4427933.1 nicotinamide riboside transporter PnuC [Paludibacter sp.]
MVQYIQQHYIEIIGSVLSLIYLYLSIKQRISLWIFGFLCSALYIVVFFQSKFYADMSLQFYYLGVSVFGWISWKTGKQHSGKELPVKKTKKLQALVLSLITFVVFLLYYFVLSRYTDSPLPFADSFTTALSITATWMLARKLIEHWLLWVVVDALSAGLYIYKELYPTAILFFVYTVMAVVGWMQWRRSLN